MSGMNWGKEEKIELRVMFVFKVLAVKSLIHLQKVSYEFEL